MNWSRIKYAMSWPSSTDPFYLANTADQTARRSYYGVNSIPAGFGNGATVGGSASSWRSSGLSNMGAYTPITIEFNGGMVDEELQMSVTVSSETNQTNTDLRLFVMTSIDSVYYNSPSAYDNFHNVFIEFLTNSSGQSLSLDGVTNYTQEFNWSMPSPWPNNNTSILWDISDLNVVAFVQNYSTKEVLQAEWARTNNLKNLEMIVLIDMDERYEKNYSSIVEKFKSRFNIRLIQIDIEKNTQKNNYLSKISKGDLLFIVADDMIFSKNWDICINDEANKFDKFKPFMIWPKEKGFKYPFLHNNAPIINRVWFNKCGFFQPEELHHFYADNWMCDIGRKYGQFIITKEVIYDHLHSEKKDGLIDETHRNTMKRSKNYNEEKIYYELKNLQNDVVKRLLN